MMVCSGRLPGAMQLGWEGSRTNPAPRLCRSTPVFGLTSPVPKVLNSELMKLTAFLSRSTTHR